MRRPSPLRVSTQQLAAGAWVDEEGTWFGGGRLFLARTGAAHSICPSWRSDYSFIGWYVNLEDPWRRTHLGFDTKDHVLDIWVLADRSWRWKDEDELEAAVGAGLFTLHEAKAIREEGERVIERVEAWTEPFNEGWEQWRPDPDWPLPSVPEGWDRL
jgi:predicted RNA-binding protein associated with RNAse of E/G family